MFDLHTSQESKNDSIDAHVPDVALQPITVLIVDDHALVRSAISLVLAPRPEIQLVVVAQNYIEAEAQASKHNPDVIWLDLHIARFDGIAEIYRLRKLAPTTSIIALADVEEEQEAFAAIMAGAQGYCSKQDINPDDVPEMIDAVHRGQFVLRSELLTHLMQRLRAAAMPLWGSENRSGTRALLRDAEYNGLTQLTAREREILQLISQGYRDRDIAEGLHISEKTVQKHVQSILNKLGAQNRTEAAYFIHCQFAL